LPIAQPSRGWFRRGVVVTALVLALNAAASSLAGQTPAFWDGDFVSEPEATVRFSVVQKHGEAKRVLFGVRGLEVDCEDGTSQRYFKPATSYPLHGPTHFHRVFFDVSEDGDWSIFSLQGTLKSRSRAAGSLLLIYHHEERDGAAPVDCSTDGPLTWTARKR
jgi:hypothetical protein